MLTIYIYSLFNRWGVSFYVAKEVYKIYFLINLLVNSYLRDILIFEIFLI